MIFLLLLISSFQVNAIVLTGDTTGFFVDGDVESNTVEWGGGFSPHSSLMLAAEGAFSAEMGVPFKIATLTYDNKKTFEVLSEADLTIKLSFVQSEVIKSLGFNYKLTINETNNRSDNSDDRVMLTPVVEFEPLFNLNGEEYIFSLLGFKKGDDVLGYSYENFFDQPENSNSSSELYAVIDKLKPVPVPSAIWLFITALSGFFISSKRRVI